MSEYEEQAKAFLKEFGFKLSISLIDTVYNPFNEGTNDGPHDKYRITLRHLDTGKSFTYNFFNSIHAHETGEWPSAYDVLSCIGVESYEPEGDKYDWFNEFCYEPSAKNEKLYRRVKRFAKRINGFFTDEELEKLREI